jgi:hypothetical protein
MFRSRGSSVSKIRTGSKLRTRLSVLVDSFSMKVETELCDVLSGDKLSTYHCVVVELAGPEDACAVKLLSIDVHEASCYSP